MIWNETVNANCRRDSRSAVRSIGISSLVLCDPFGMREHLEPVVARDAHQRQTGCFCSAHGQGRRRGYPDYDRCSHHAGLLHELDRNPTRQYDDALSSRLASAQQRARQFVERIVPPKSSRRTSSRSGHQNAAA